MVDAKRDYDEAIRLNPHNADNYFNRGNVFLNQSQFEEAHADFDRAIDLENANAKLYHAKGLAFQAQAEALARSQEFAFEEEENRIAQAIAYFGQALHFSPEFISPMFHQGLMFRRTNRFHEALRQFSKVEELLSGDKTVYIQRGLVYQDMGNHSFAIRDFQEAIEIDRQYSLSHFHLGVSKLKSRQIREAIDEFELAEDCLKRDGSSERETNPGIFDGLACCYQALKDYP